MPYGPRGIYRLIPNLTWQCEEQVASVLARVGNGAKVVDLGAGGRRISPKTVALDFVAGPGTNVVGDVQRLPFRDGSVDLVFATGLFEHVEDERAVIGEIRRVLKTGGLVHVEIPFLEAYHEDPIDVRRLTADGLDRAMRRAGFKTLRRGGHIGPTVALVSLAARWGALWFEGDGKVAKILSFATFTGASIVLWPLKFLDRLLSRKKGAHGLSMGVYFTGEKT